MQVTQNIKLNIYQTSEYLHVSAKQADDNSRFLRITFTDGKNDLPVPSSAIVSLRALKPDKTSILDSGVVNEDGTVTVELTDQVLAVEGIVRADVMTSQGGEILSTATFLIRVGAVPIGTEVVSSNEFLQLVELYEEISELMPVDTDNIVDGAVTTPKLADDAVTSGKIADGAVTNAKIAEGTITGNKFVPALPITEVKATTSGAKYEQSVTTKLGVTHTALLVTSDHYQNALGAVAFSTTATYAVGDYVVYNKKIYKCINAHSGAWADADFEETKVLPRLDDVEENVTTINSELTAITEGTTAVGTAEQLLSNKYNTDTEPYHFRRVPFDATRELPTICGGSLGWNQYINPTFATGTKDGLTITNNADGSITVDGTATANGYKILTNVFALTTNHVYYVRGYKKVGSNGGSFNLGGMWADTGDGRMGKNTQGYTSSSLRFSYVSGDSFSNTKMYPQFSNLTQMFGSTIADYIYSLEQATTGAGVAWVNRYIDLSKYHAFDSGSIQSVTGLVSHDTVGYNQWDEEWELISNILNSKNYIPVLPNTQYYITPHQGRDYLCFDGEYNAIGVWTWLASAYPTFTTPSNCRYIKFRITSGYGTSYKSDICINISDPIKNGQYEPYTKHTYALDPTVTLRGVPKLDSNNNLYFDGDVWNADGTVNRKYGYVDLGTLTWSKSDTVYMTTLNDGKAVSNGNVFTDAPYKYINTSETATNMIFKSTVSGGKQALYFRNDDVSDVNAFKATVTGKYLVYELATPTTETATPYTAMQICDGYGTEEYITESVVPVGHTTKYPINQVSKLDGLPSDFSTLISPVEKTYKATRNYTTGSLLIVNNILYKATANIQNGGTITPNTNVVATTLSEVIASLA